MPAGEIREAPRTTGAGRAAHERRATLIAVALSDGRRRRAVLDDGTARAFRTDLATVSIPFPTGLTPRALTCAIAVQCAPSKETVAALPWPGLRRREREALAWEEGDAAVRWASGRWPGLAPDLAALFPWVDPTGPDDPSGDELLARARERPRERGTLPPLFGALPPPRPGGPDAGSSTRVATRWSQRRRARRGGLLQVPVSGPASELVLEPGAPGTIDALDGLPDHALGIPYDEWDHRRERYRRAHVRVLERPAAPAGPIGAGTSPLVLAAARPARSRRRHREQGEVDIDAVVRWRCDAAAGRTSASATLYAEPVAVPASIAWALLIDASASASRSGGRLLRRAVAAADAVGAALSARGDHVAVFTFCSHARERVEVGVLKEFGAPFVPLDRALRPGGYTRLGAAVRHVGSRLLEAPAQGHALLSFGDALPYDEGYGEAYGRADVAKAVGELQDRGAVVQHASIAGHDAPALDEMFGARGWTPIVAAASLQTLVHAAQAELAAAA